MEKLYNYYYYFRYAKSVLYSTILIRKNEKTFLNTFSYNYKINNIKKPVAIYDLIDLNFLPRKKNCTVLFCLIVRYLFI